MLENVRLVRSQPPLRWIDDRATEDDLLALKKEAVQADPFDRMQMKRSLWRDLKAGAATLTVKSCARARVVCIQPVGEEMPIPWELWGLIFQWFDIQQNIRILFFMAPNLRLLPLRGEAVGPECINGGYTLACRTDAIVIYRYEEATRVLIHELFHAACTDNFGFSTELREAKTETWAELIYVAVLSRGSMALLKTLWDIQSQWIVDQNAILRMRHGVKTLEDYAARYTLARERELKNLGVSLPGTVKNKDLISCRFTCAELDTYLFTSK